MQENLYNMSNNIIIFFSGMINLGKKQFAKKSFQVAAKLNETVKDLITRFFQLTGLSPDNYHLKFSGKHLQNYETSTLAQIGLANNSKIEIEYFEKESCNIDDDSDDGNEGIANAYNKNTDANVFANNNYNKQINYNYNPNIINNPNINCKKAISNNNIRYPNNNIINNQNNNYKKAISNKHINYPNNINNFPASNNHPNFPVNNIQNQIVNQPNNNNVYVGTVGNNSLNEIGPRNVGDQNSEYIENDIFSKNNNQIMANNQSKFNPLNYEISIKFIKYSNYSQYNNLDRNLKGLLKLCFLNEIAPKINEQVLNNLLNNRQIPEIVYFILQILKQCHVSYNNRNEAVSVIKKVIGNNKGCNVLNFSNFVEEQVSQQLLQQLINYVPQNYINDIRDTKLRLGKYENYMAFFEQEIRKSLKRSIFEFSPVSLVVIDRENFDRFEQEKSRCPNTVVQLLFHGTQQHPISCILTDMFIRSENKCYQFGKGVYFTDFLDYCYFYGSPKGNRNNINIIPPVGTFFTAVCSLVYYDKSGFLKVTDHKTREKPGKNQVNFAFSSADSKTLYNPDPRKFVGTEYVVYDFDQILPLISIKFKREEFCVIWRDDNFSDKAIFNNEFDEKFKNFLKDRLRYINQMAKYNVYTFSDTNEALKYVNRKKYNKIILISNVGTDFGGQKFVTAARQIIGGNVIALFNAYNTQHLSWITQWKNTLFLNNDKLFGEYLDSFSNETKMRGFIAKLEKIYNVRFNFDKNFLTFPQFREKGYYSELSF